MLVFQHLNFVVITLLFLKETLEAVKVNYAYVRKVQRLVSVIFVSM